MIQRKQSIFLLLALIASVVCLCLPLGSLELKGMGATPVLYNLALASADGTYNFNYCPLFVMLALSSLFSLVTIFLYRNRKLQMSLCRINLLFICIWYAILAFDIFFVFKDMGTFYQGIAACLPFVAAIFVWLAHRGIVSDEKLVRAADRIR